MGDTRGMMSSLRISQRTRRFEINTGVKCNNQASKSILTDSKSILWLCAYRQCTHLQMTVYIIFERKRVRFRQK